MEIKDNKDYCIADISDEDINKISELEKMISTSTNKEIVLIAYQSNYQSNKDSFK